MRHRLLGTNPLEVVSADDRQKQGIAADGIALRIKGFPPDFVKDKKHWRPNVYRFTMNFLEGGLQPREHVVERVGQRAQLVARTGERHPLGQVVLRGRPAPPR